MCAALCRMFDIGLTYLSVIASAVAASLPLVPVCLVAVPAALQLFAQVKPVCMSTAVRAQPVFRFSVLANYLCSTYISW